MMNLIKYCAAAVLICSIIGTAEAAPRRTASNSVYKTAPKDEKAVYFTPENFPITNDGKTDVTASLQKAINDLKQSQNMGIVFIPEGDYLISGTVYIPKSIRVIGYGNRRPVFILAKNSPGFQEENPDDKGKAKYMFWFVDRAVTDSDNVRDAGPGTFYSCMSNIDIVISDGNPAAVAFRTHYAQHSFLSHIRVNIGKGKAAIFDAGNEMEDMEFIGGEVGLYTTRTSPSWQVMLVNVSFEGQRRAAILTEEAGMVIKRMNVKNTPVAVEIAENRSEKLYLEDCTFDNVSDCGVLVSHENFSPSQLTIRNVVCRNVPVAVRFRESGRKIDAAGKIYLVKSLTNGLHIDNMAAIPEHKTLVDMEALNAMPAAPHNDIPSLPQTSEWVNVRELGLVGDGIADDTEALRRAIATHETLYFPQGWYKITDRIVLGENTKLIGLNPITTHIFIEDCTPAFSGFGGPWPLIETPVGGHNIINGIGIGTSAINNRAVGIKWQSGADSYMNDTKFLGLHGTVLQRSTDYVSVQRTSPGNSTVYQPVSHLAKDKAWDSQHWSLWITNGGGGTFKDIWSANSYATNGIYVSDTDTPSNMYEVSVEHHVRNEVRFKNVHNWNVYALQLEEEIRESPDVQQIELQECSNMMFADLFTFRVIWVDTPLPVAVRTWNCRDIEFFNVHNFTQMRYTADVTIADVNTKQQVLPWEFTYLKISGNEANLTKTEDGITRLASGFEFAEGAAIDSKGNVYFCEQRLRRIYKWDAASGSLTLLADMPWAYNALAVDTDDNLLVLVKYTPSVGEDRVKELPDRNGTTFSHWGNSGFETRVAVLNPDDPEDSFKVLERVPMSSVKKVSKVYYPSHRWRDLNDFDEISTYAPEYCFVAPDGKTVIPQYYDILRSSSLIEGVPGSRVYSSDEYNHRVVSLLVGEDGSLSSPEEFSSVGEFNAIPGLNGKVLVADGYLYIFNGNGSLDKTVRFPERPSSMVLSEEGTLYVTARSGFYSYRQPMQL